MYTDMLWVEAKVLAVAHKGLQDLRGHLLALISSRGGP